MSDFETFRRTAEGSECMDLLVQQFYADGELIDHANVLFLRLASHRWLRFFLDAGVFFWREVSDVDRIASAEAAPGHTYPLVPVNVTGLVGSRVKEVQLSHVPSEKTELTIWFESGALLTLANASDKSILNVTAPVA